MKIAALLICLFITGIIEDKFMDTYTSIQDAIEGSNNWNSTIHSIRHLVELPNDTYAIVGHINCEHCDYCKECTKEQFIKNSKYWMSGPHKYKKDIYEISNSLQN